MQTDVQNRPEKNSQADIHSKANTNAKVSASEVARAGKKGNGRKHFVMVCIAFILPVILAKMALEQQWFNYGVTNQGQLLAEPVSLSQLSLTDIQTDKHWLLVFNSPAPCEKACQQSMNALSNTYLALGKEMPRVQPVLLNYTKHANQTETDTTFHITTATDTESVGKAQSDIDVSRWQKFNVPELSHPELQRGKVFIVDPLGNVVMTHQPPQTADALPAFGKAIVADMKKLLKYSRIG
ncbi:hypothetical protein [Thalassotalea euphylliae]|uniref:Thioredoxin domain-containing protein n=1 Tax=Thalassotalea euphylliae TaxID=1655234 RepID=A0A3E0U312_9GAMM|nr:hypothetical protein [Thalassotalea euphylliae]REL31110.1 hypothetical protein DXX94_10535 [Thalassotalea euphylliae]